MKKDLTDRLSFLLIIGIFGMNVLAPSINLPLLIGT